MCVHWYGARPKSRPACGSEPSNARVANRLVVAPMPDPFLTKLEAAERAPVRGLARQVVGLASAVLLKSPRAAAAAVNRRWPPTKPPVANQGGSGSSSPRSLPWEDSVTSSPSESDCEADDEVERILQGASPPRVPAPQAKKPKAKVQARAPQPAAAGAVRSIPAYASAAGKKPRRGSADAPKGSKSELDFKDSYDSKDSRRAVKALLARNV